jgi:A/G-specific adenine glycosylase
MMDYGAFLKLRGVRINHKKKGYVKQKPFKGSLREVRGAVLRTLLHEKQLQSLHYPQIMIQKAMQELRDEGLISKIGRKFVLPK